MSDYKILVKYASRGRPERFFDGLNTIRNLCYNQSRVFTLVTLDTDDLTMNNDEVKEKIAQYPNVHPIYGKSEGKIHAINRDLDLIPDEWKDWDIVANFSDDMRWTMNGWDELIRADFRQFSPDCSHFMAYLDEDAKGAISTLYIAGRKWFDRFGYIYNPVYLSLFCDNEIEDIAKMLGKYHYTGYTIYKHLLPAYGHLPEDNLWRTQQDLGWTVDMKTYNERKEKNFYL